MNIFKFIERFFPKLFIGIWLNNGRYYLTIKNVLPSGKTSIENISFDKDVELEQMFQFLLKSQTDNIVTYIGFLDDSEFQGALPVINKQEYLWFPEITEYKEYDDILFKVQNSSWTLFSLKTELVHSQNRLKRSGIDFIFSPFLIPIVIQKKFKLSKDVSIFILAEKDLTIFTIFKGDKLLFGKYVNDIDFNEVSINELKEEIEKDEVFKFDDLDSDIESSENFKNQDDSTFFNEDEIDLDDFLDKNYSNKDDPEDELKNLDLLLNQESEAKSVKNIELHENSDDNNVKYSKREDIAELEKFLDEDMEEEEFEEKRLIKELDLNYDLIYKTITASVQTFYSNNRFESDFIENCYILTSLKVSSSFIQKIEDEFSFETEKIRVDLSELVVDLMGEELG